MNGELVYELSGGFVVPVQLIAIIAVLFCVALPPVFWTRLRTVWPFSTFQFGLKSSWARFLAPCMVLLIAGGHLAMENLARREVERRIQVNGTDTIEGCISSYQEIEIANEISGVIVNGQSFAGASLYHRKEALNAIQNHFEVGDPIRIEHVEGDIVRVWTVESGSMCEVDEG